MPQRTYSQFLSSNYCIHDEKTAQRERNKVIITGRIMHVISLNKEVEKRLSCIGYCQNARDLTGIVSAQHHALPSLVNIITSWSEEGHKLEIQKCTFDKKVELEKERCSL